MRKTWRQIILTGLALLLLLTANVNSGWTQGRKHKNADSGNLQQRIDFGNAYIIGQSIKSGAVYLLHRKQSDISSMLHHRQDYREEILEDFEVRDLTGNVVKVKSAQAAGKNEKR